MLEISTEHNIIAVTYILDFRCSVPVIYMCKDISQRIYIFKKALLTNKDTIEINTIMILNVLELNTSVMLRMSISCGDLRKPCEDVTK